MIATLNLNGDYLSDALAAQVGGIGIAPGGNINYVTGHAIFEATHGTAPKYADLDKVNPGSVILSGEMMLRYMGWTEAADAIITAMDKSIGQKTVTYDFARLMEGATEVKCSEFGDAVIQAMGWAQTSNYALVRALENGTAQIDEYSWEIPEGGVGQDEVDVVRAAGAEPGQLGAAAAVEVARGQAAGDLVGTDEHEGRQDAAEDVDAHRGAEAAAGAN